MIGDLKASIGKIAKDRLVVGLDISDEFSQVSYAYMNGEEAKTLSAKEDGEDLCIPTKLGKFYGQNIWTFGSKAEEMALANEGYIISDLLEKARNGVPIEIENRDYDPTDLLALFIKKCLSLLKNVAALEKVSNIVITVENPDNINISILTKAINILRIKSEKVFFQSYGESIFNYVIMQKKELWLQDVVVCHLKKEGLVIRSFKVNRNVMPNLVMMDEKTYDNISYNKLINGNEMVKDNLDNLFKSFLMSFIMNNHVSTIYLLGTGFEQQWYKESLKYMCQKSRVFLGNNLFSKGAAYGARARIIPDDNYISHVFIGKDKIKSNVGIMAFKDGEESYIDLLEAGKNWYESNKECEFIIDETDKIDFIVTPIDADTSKIYSVFMDGIPKRPGKSTRVRIELKMSSEKILNVLITDLGFGEFFPPTGLRFKSDIVID